MAIRAVIFDMGGVWLRTEDPAPRAALANRLGISIERLSSLVFDAPTAALATVGQASEAEHWDYVREKLGLSSQQMDAFQQEFWSGDQSDSELLEFIGNLRPRYKTGLLSNAWSGARASITQRYPGSLEFFDVLVYSAEVGLAKPDPAIFEYILKQLEVQPEEAIFVDDFPNNIEAARKIGLQVIHFKNSMQVRREISALIG